MGSPRGLGTERPTLEWPGRGLVAGFALAPACAGALPAQVNCLNNPAASQASRGPGRSEPALFGDAGRSSDLQISRTPERCHARTTPVRRLNAGLRAERANSLTLRWSTLQRQS